MTRLTRWLIVGLLVLLCSGFALAQQPVQDLGSGSINTSLASWTSATSVPTCVTPVSNTSQYNSVLVTLIQPSGLTGGVVTFKESLDNSNWFNVQGVQLGPTAIVGPTYTMVASTNGAFLFPLGAAPYFEVCLTTAITGSGTTIVQDALQSFAQAALLAGLVSGSGIFQVSPTTAANSVTNPFAFQPSDGTNGMGLMTNFGTTPGAVKAQNVNASLFIGTAIVSSSNPFPISATGAANTKTNEIFSNITDHTNSLSAAISALGTAPTGTDVLAVNAVNLPSTAAGTALSSAAQATLTSSVNVKASAGTVFGVSVLSGATTGCWLEFINSASAGTLGTAVIFSIALPNAGILTIPPGMFPLGSFSNGIAMGVATTNGGSSACGTSSSVTIFYK